MYDAPNMRWWQALIARAGPAPIVGITSREDRTGDESTEIKLGQTGIVGGIQQHRQHLRKEWTGDVWGWDRSSDQNCSRFWHP